MQTTFFEELINILKSKHLYTKVINISLKNIKDFFQNNK